MVKTYKLINRLINKEYLTEREYKEWLRTIKEDFIVLEKENEQLKGTENNEKLKKALELACEMLSWDCPVSQNLINDLDCDACCDNYKECWKKYFMKKVLDNDK